LGLALIAAAAAASPAASISLLIAAFASLSTASLLEDDPVELLRAALAIASSPSIAAKDTLPP
jgi:streptomycin 6-kinase